MSRFGSLVAALFIATALPASAQPRGLAAQLQRGGLVLVMRHAHAPRETPSAPDPGNRARERQLDAQGKRAARDLGLALRRLHIPIGQVLSSPTYRARETARLAGFPAPTIAAELGDGGRSMQRLGAPQGGWLRQQANQAPPRGGNRLIVTQMPNIVAAFPQEATGLEDGETLVFRPDRRGARLVARVKIDAWARMH